MNRLKTTPAYKRKASKILKRNQLLIKRYKKALSYLEKNPFYFGLKTHQVRTLQFGTCYSSRVTGDIRILWRFEKGKIVILLLDIGGHDEVYGK